MKPGDRVQLHPATDRWMMGDRYGEVLRIIPAIRTMAVLVRPAAVVVRLDKSGKVQRFHVSNILEVL